MEEPRIVRLIRPSTHPKDSRFDGVWLRLGGDAEIDGMNVVRQNIPIVTSHQEDLVRTKVADDDVVHEVRACGVDKATNTDTICRPGKAEEEFGGSGYDLLEALGDGNEDVVSGDDEIELSASATAMVFVTGTHVVFLRESNQVRSPLCNPRGRGAINAVVMIGELVVVRSGSWMAGCRWIGGLLSLLWSGTRSSTRRPPCMAPP